MNFRKHIIYIVLLASTVFCHPHVFITCNPTLVFDDKGFRRAKLEWIFDEMYSFDILMALTDGNQDITEEEFHSLQAKFEETFGPLGYHTHFFINDEELDIQEIFNFEVEVNYENKVVFRFETPLYLPLKEGKNEFVFATYDDTRYFALLPDNGVIVNKTDNVRVRVTNKNKITFNVEFSSK